VNFSERIFFNINLISILKHLNNNCTSIEDFEFCYQHINAATKSNNACSWVEENGEKCNQLAIPETKIVNNNGNLNESHKTEKKK
jgi:transglutaminase/protease-like cytokinesis protein 3